jgi:arylsulfatase A-like enzyme
MIPPATEASRSQRLAARAVGLLGRAGRVCLAGALAGLAVGASDLSKISPATWGPLARFWGPVDAAGGAVAALGLACGLALVGPVFGAASRRLGLGRMVSRDPAADRAPVVRLHAGVIASALSALGLGAAMFGFVVVLRRIQVEAVREKLFVGAAVGGALFAGALFAALFSLVRPLVVRVDRRVVLPRPASSRLRVVAFVAVPMVALAAGGIAALGSSPAIEQPLRWLGFSGLWLALSTGLSALTRWKVLSRASAALGGLALALSLALAARVPGGRAMSTLERAGSTAAMLRVLRATSDFDLDGSSGLFGGGDCRPFSRAIHPRAAEIASNGVDEDCDGRDGVSALSAGGPRFYEGLDPALVKRRDVVWFIIDAVRADHVGHLGYKRPTTPYVDRLAEKSLVFTNAYSQSSATMFSIPSMFSGVESGRMDWVLDKQRPQASDRDPLLAERLRREGYRTAMVGSFYFRTRVPGLLKGFETVKITSAEQTESATDAAVLATEIIHESRADGRPLFLTVYLAAPHLPYVPHEEGYPSFGSGQTALYDGELAYADRHLGFIVDVLSADRAQWENTIVLVTSDHGEELGEHGGTAHAQTCYEESVHVPLVLRVPGVEPARVEARVGLVDIATTLVELLGLPREDTARMNGHSLIMTALAPSGGERPIPCAIVRQARGEPRQYRRAVRYGKWTLYQDLSSGRVETLFDTSTDRFEQRPVDLVGEAGAAADTLREVSESAFGGNMSALDFYDE